MTEQIALVLLVITTNLGFFYPTICACLAGSGGGVAENCQPPLPFLPFFRWPPRDSHPNILSRVGVVCQ